MQVKVPDWPPIPQQQNCEQALEPKTVHPDETALPSTAVRQVYKAWEVYTETFLGKYSWVFLIPFGLFPKCIWTKVASDGVRYPSGFLVLKGQGKYNDLELKLETEYIKRTVGCE